jgi:AcrR family transcriptional regulator
MVESARELFRNQGYRATSTREISDHAGVAESMLFRHFGTKNAIFEEAVLKPFVEFVQAFIDDWVASAPVDVVPEQLAYSYVTGFLTLCNENLDLVMALGEPNADDERGPFTRQAATLMQEHLDTLAEQVDSYHAQIGLQPAMDSKLVVRLTVAIIVGTAQLGSGFLGELDEATLAEIAAFIVRGAGYPSDGRVTDRPPNSLRHRDSKG